MRGAERKAVENKGKTDQEVVAPYVRQRMNTDGCEERRFERRGSMKYWDLTESYDCVGSSKAAQESQQRRRVVAPRFGDRARESCVSSVDIHREMRKWNFVEALRGNTVTDRQWGGIRKFCQT